ncbi:hypothetical protein niasHS_014914 [Heterodera schachtii]|uniref:C2H2-type domain-containing protein n=1 Tax=Heterodera schachtii TaxID=97005 RepID=A0ABD2IL31_HETSC
MFNCQICISECVANASNSPRFSSFDQLEAHLAADHFSLLPYECEHCQFAKFPTEFAVMKHNELDHDSRNYSFRCRITPEVKEKRSKMREFLTREKHLNERAEKEQFVSSPMEVEKKRKAKDGQTKNAQIKGNDGKEEEKPKRMCLRPRPFNSDGNTTAKNCESANETTVVSLGGEEEEDDEDEEMESEGSSLTEELKEQQANVQEILRATAAAVSQFGGPKNQVTPPTNKRHSANNSYSLRPNRFKPYALLHNGIPILTDCENDVLQIAEDSPEMEPSPSKSERKRSKSKTAGRIRCKKCKEMVNASGGCLSHHTNARHLRLPMFHCELCKRDFFEVSNTRITKHMNEQHKGSSKHLVNNYHKFSALLHAARDECFGGKGQRNENGKADRKSTTKSVNSNDLNGKPLEKEGEKNGRKKSQCKGIVALKNDFKLNLSSNENDCRPKKEGEKGNGAAMPPIDKYSFLVSCPDRHFAEFERQIQNGEEQNSIKEKRQNGDNQRIPCKKCGEMVWNQTVNRLNHVNVRHLQLPLHQCAVCQKSFTSYSRSACSSHIQFAHKAEIDSGKCSKVIEEHIIYRKDAYDGQLLEAVKDYF